MRLMTSTPANLVVQIGHLVPEHASVGTAALDPFAAVMRGLRRLLQRPHLDDAVRNGARSL